MQPTSILVVEDERIVAMDISATLRRLGYMVPAIASSGDEAIRYVAKYRPDLVLMDIRLSGPMDGIEVTEHIRTDYDVPVIYLTAHTDRETQQRARETAPYGYLVKPFDERTLQTSIDMTIERHARDRQTRANEQRLLTTLTSIGDAVLITDAMRRIIFLNPVAESLLHCAARAVIGLPIDDVMLLIDAETHAPIRHPVWAVLRNGEAVVPSVEALLIAQDGRQICIDYSAAPIRTLAGQIEGVAIVFRDATLRRQLNEEKQHERLRILAGGIAHDLNNLLTVVISNAELIQLDMDERAPAQADLEMVKTAAHRAADLARHLLAYAGGARVQLEPVDLNPLVEETIELLSSSTLKAITVHTQLGPNLLPFDADAAQLQQVVQNLLINAAEAIGDQDGTVTVTTAIRHFSAADLRMIHASGELRSGSYVMLEIADTGRGMDAATCERIFEPFFTTKFVGRGLGLAAVQGVIRDHGGAISVTSAPSQGATFMIRLPYVPSGTLMHGSQPAPTPWHGQGTVFVVDDEASVRSAITRVLERLGLSVLTAPNGSSALEVFRSQLNVIDCVLLDLTMPGMSGSEVAHAMRAIHPSLPIVLMSGYNQADMARSIQDVTRMRFLHKPFSLMELYTALQWGFAMWGTSRELGK